MNAPSTNPLFPEAPPSAAAIGSAVVSADVRCVAQAMSLLWSYHSRRAIQALLTELGFRREDGRAFNQEDVRRAIEALGEKGWREDQRHRDGYYRLHDHFRGPLYRELLEGHPAAKLRAALHRAESFRPEQNHYYWPIYDTSATVALVRLELFCGASAKDLARLKALIERSLDWGEILWSAVFPAFDGALFDRVNPEWRWDIAYSAVREIGSSWRADVLPIGEWAMAKLAGEKSRLPEHLRLAIAEILVHRGEPSRVRDAIEGLSCGAADAMEACLLVQQSRWEEGQLKFEAALKRRQSELGARKRVFPASIAWLYPLALLAQRTPKHLELARKFCRNEAGQRELGPHAGWGSWAHVIGVGLGDEPLNETAFNLKVPQGGGPGIDELWRLMLAAWLGAEAMGLDARSQADGGRVSVFADAIRARLKPCRLEWLVAQVDAAEAVLRGQAPTEGFFVSGPGEEWRNVLAALEALGAEQAKPGSIAESSRVLWAIGLGEGGIPERVEPLEQKRGPRGWSKPKPLGLAKIAGNRRLQPWDAKVARAIRQDRSGGRRFVIDRAAAIMALVGHPAVVLADAPERLVDLVEGTPEVEVVKEGDRYRMHVTPSPRLEPRGEEPYYFDSENRRELEELRTITVLQDTPQRLRVIRMTAAQRRAAQLVSGRFAVPSSAQEELQQALRALAGHFQVHADHAQAAREVAPESRLRAELSPAGEHLLLRLVVAPLGVEGPRLQPGSGRARVMSTIAGETVGTRRDLIAERAHLDSLLDALPYLEEPDEAGGCEWMITDPENALAIVEALPKHAALGAVEWPKGKQLRVVTVDSRQLGVVVSGERDWFRLRGQMAVDERLVLDFEALLAAGGARSRFVPMGEGVYAALTRRLKQQLADLAALAQTGPDGVRIPRLAAAWLDETLEGAKVSADAEFGAAIERLRRAQAESAPLPKAMQAELRPYQEDGYRWAMRLASAGLGGCLADDMGLGKTLQGLAVLLARRDLGAALVIAPTSVCGNWLAEAQRFAPSLNFMIYGEGERETLVANAGVGDVVVVSYTLLQQANERFAARSWSTVIADEAQAIKNAAAKRSLAVFDLDTGFRLALSGTPVENRLAELWSIMRFANPGLLGTLSRFTERFATPIERNRDRDAQHLLKRLIGPFVLRRTKAQVLEELPPRTELVVAVAPEAGEAAHYEALRRQAIAEADHAISTAPMTQATFNILAQLTRLRRAACDPRLVSPEAGVVGAKVQTFADLAVELAANGHKALVFSQFVDFLQLLRAPLDAAGIAYQYLDGATPAAERTRRVAAFQAGQGDLFLISLKAGGFGLNLTAADYVLITDPWWNPAAEDQAMGRAHRIGQSKPVTVYRMVTKGTVEERIVALHQDKRALAESIIAEGEAAALPSAEDLVALIRAT